MTALAIGFGLGFFVAAQLGPISLLAIRSTLRSGVAIGLAIAAGIGLGSLTCMSLLAGGVSVARRWVGPRMLRAVDGIAGAGILAFGGLLAFRTLRD
jgi:putative LysE/RhtB family amino acid efflux pump